MLSWILSLAAGSNSMNYTDKRLTSLAPRFIRPGCSLHCTFPRKIRRGKRGQARHITTPVAAGPASHGDTSPDPINLMGPLPQSTQEVSNDALNGSSGPPSAQTNGQLLLQYEGPSPRRKTNGTSSQSPHPSASIFHDTSSIGCATDDVHAPKPDDAYSDDGDRDDANDFMPDDLSSDVGVKDDADAIGDVNDIGENDARRERHGPNPLCIKRGEARTDVIQQGALFDLPMFTSPYGVIS